jgi:hypothetical protein
MVTSFLMAGWIMGRGCCGMWVRGMYGYRCAAAGPCLHVEYGVAERKLGSRSLTERDGFATIFFRVVGWGPENFWVYLLFLVI